MAENSLNARIKVDADASPVDGLIKVLKRLEKVSADLANSLPAAAEALAEFGGAAEATKEASDGAVKSAKNLDKSIGGGQNAKKSTVGLKNYVKTVNDLRAVLGKGGPKPLNLFGDNQEAIGEIKELEAELLQLVNVYRTGFGQQELLADQFDTQSAVQELSDLRKAVSDLSQAASGSSGIDFNLDQTNSDLIEFTEQLEKANNIGEALTVGENALVQLQDFRQEANRIANDEIPEIQRELRRIGPAAEDGSQDAIQQVGELSQKLKTAQSRAQELGKGLREGQEEFARQVANQNKALGAFGFDQVTAEDIFPDQEQQKLRSIQQNIDKAALQSAERGAVKTSLNAFLSKDAQLDAVDDGIVNMTNHLPRLRYALYDVSQSLTVLGGGLIAVGVSLFKVNAEFERAFADVERTVFNATDKSTRAVSRLRNELVELSTSIPVGFAELAQIATLAGQLNVAEERVASFTGTVAKFSATTDVTIDAAATAFGRLDALVQGVDGQFEKLASSILAVGVNSVATESDIIAISAQIASIANIAGFSASELIGFSSALASVGTRPELARGTFTRLFTEIQQSVSEGGDQLEAFARTANQSVDQFTSAWGAGSGTEQVIAILRGLEEAGTDADRVLAELGITSVRDVPTLLKLAQGVEAVEEQIRIANIGFIEGIELNNQYGIISATISERLKVLQNTFASLIDTVGRSTAGFGLLIDSLSFVLKVVERLIDNPVTGTFLALAAAATIVSGAIFIFGGALTRAIASTVGLLTTMIEVNTAIAVTSLGVSKLNVDLTQLTVTTDKATTSFGALGAAAAGAGAKTRAAGIAARLGKIGAVILAITAVVGVIDILGEQFGFWGDSIDKTNDKLENFGTLQAAVKKDTEAFSKATSNTKGEFQVFNAEIQKSNVGLSERGRVIAAITGQEELFADSADGTSTVIKEQTFAIGENTKEVIKQELALRLYEDASKSVFNAEEARLAQQRVAIAQGKIAARQAEIDAGRIYDAYGAISAQDVLVEGEGRASYIGSPATAAVEELQDQSIAALLEVIQDPRLTVALQDSGFDISEWADAVASGNTRAAESIAEGLSPALEELATKLEEQNPELFADEIDMIRFAQEAGADALNNYNSLGDDMIEMLKQAAFEQAIFGDTTEETAEQIKNAQKDTFDEIMEAAFGPINAQNALNDSMVALGGTFANEGGAIAATSQELQTVLSNLWETSDGGEDAAQTFAGFYNAIVEGGYATGSQLEVLQGIILETYRTFMSQQINAAKQAVETQKIISQFAEPPERDLATVRLRNAQIELEKLEGAFDGFDFDVAKKVNIDGLTQGFNKATSSARGTADAVEEIVEETEEAVEEVRTLLDYASDLENVFSRAFSIRFGAAQGIDDIAEAWLAFTEQVEDAQGALEELQATQQDLSADRAIKEYFLSVAEAYDDELRAAQLRREIADLNREQADNQIELDRARSLTGNATDLTGQTEGGRQNRQALLGLVSNYQSYIGVLAESGASQDELRQATAKAKAEFIDQARELGFAEQDIMMYAAAFDDVRTAIDNVPRNITVDANVNPALQALNELNASLQTQIRAANDLNRALNQPVSAPSGGNGGKVEIVDRYEVIVRAKQAAGIGLSTPVASMTRAQRAAIGLPYYDGGFTGRGGAMDPAGIVHKGEYVVPQKYVNQSTGMPDPNFLAQLQNGMRGYQMGGFVGGASSGNDSGTMMVELSPYDRKLLSDAGNVQLRLNGKVVAEATNRSNVVDAQRGAN